MRDSQRQQIPTVCLATVTDDHLRTFYRWFHETRPETQTCRPVSIKSAEEVIQRYRGVPQVFNSQDFSVIRSSDQCLVGRVRYFDLNPRNLSAEIGYVVGPEFQNQGLATGAISLLLDLLFRTKALNKVHAQTGEFNQPSIALLKHWGFQQDGRLRQHHELDGTLHDDLIFSLLAEEYNRIMGLQ